MAKGKDLKPHIGIFGRRNNGKSSFINFLAQNEIAIVSEVAGTTTDPVKKSIEIFGIGPCVVIDTAGIDDVGDIGQKRIEKAVSNIQLIDLAILIISANTFGSYEEELISKFKKYNLPFVIVHNKNDIEKVNSELENKLNQTSNNNFIDLNVFEENYRNDVFEVLKKAIPKTAYAKNSLFRGLVNKGDIIVLVTPIDSEAPEGRMILPQQMAIRDVLDKGAINIVLKETELEKFLETGIEPKLVVTDSQAFDFVSKKVPKHIPLTSFSILFSRLKSDFDTFVKGVRKIDDLKEGDKILVLESCTHQISCEDIGRFKIPNWLQKYANTKLEFEFVSGNNAIPENIEDYAFILQCGGCVSTKKQIVNRISDVVEKGISITNYGMAIAYVNGIFKRAIEPFKM